MYNNNPLNSHTALIWPLDPTAQLVFGQECMGETRLKSVTNRAIILRLFFKMIQHTAHA